MASTDVGHDGADEGFPAIAADLFSHGGHVADFEARCATRGIGRETALEMFRGGRIEIVRDFIGHVTIGFVAMEEHAKPARYLPPERHQIIPRP